jgi:hypothetical protein
LAIHVLDIAPIAHQTAGRSKLATLEDRRQPIMERECSKPFSTADKETVTLNHQPADAQLR